MGFAIHWHESAMDLHFFSIPFPPPASFSISSLWVFPVYQTWAFVSCIQPWLVICFTLDSIFVSMLFSQTIPLSPSPTESKSLFCTTVSLFGLLGYPYHLLKFHIYVLYNAFLYFNKTATQKLLSDQGRSLVPKLNLQRSQILHHSP